MEVTDGQKFGFPVGEPITCSRSLTFGTVPVAAGVISDMRMAACAVLALGNMTAERRRPTTLDRTHHLHLIEADVAMIGKTPAGAVVTEDIRNFQLWA